MKKLMTVLAIALTAIAVNAASVNWLSGNVSALPNFAADWQGQAMYFFLVDSAAYDTSALVGSLSAGDAFNPAGADLSVALLGAPFFGKGTGAKTSFAQGDYAYGYAVIYNSIGDQFAISDVGTSAVFGVFGNASLNLGGTANFDVYEVVPEPTSFALLALGAAALGLRRRLKK
jgi:hypothetical protein